MAHGRDVPFLPVLECRNCPCSARCPKYDPAREDCFWEVSASQPDVNTKNGLVELLSESLMVNYLRFRRESNMAALDAQVDPKIQIGLTSLSREIARLGLALAKIGGLTQEDTHLHLHQDQILQFTQQTSTILQKAQDRLRILAVENVESTPLVINPDVKVA